MVVSEKFSLYLEDLFMSLGGIRGFFLIILG